MINLIDGAACETYKGESVLCDDKVGKNASIYIRGGTQALLTSTLNSDILVREVDKSASRCQDLIRRVLCLYYYPPCGFNGTFIAPVSICPEECSYVQHQCENTWKELVSILRISNPDDGFINCSNPGQILDPLPHCCVDAGITMDTSTSIPGQTNHCQIKILVGKL